MNLINKLENVRAYLPSKNIVLKNNEIISLNNISAKSIVNEASRIFDLETEILVLDDFNTPYFLTLNLELTDKKLDYKVFYVNFPYMGLYKKKPVYVDAIYDYIHEKILFQTEDSLSGIVYKNYIFTKNITCRDVQNGKVLWHYDILSIPNNPHNDNYDKNADWEVKKFIGVLGQKLWVALNHHTIIALDIETGQLLHQIHHIPSFKSEWLPSAIPLSEATVIDDKSNKLIGFMWEFYWEINPQNGEIALWDLTADFLSQRIRNDVKDFVLSEHTIYFASHFDSKIGTLDIERKKIVWQYEFAKDTDGREPRIMEIQGNDKMLGALSSDKTLYIFEKETN